VCGKLIRKEYAFSELFAELRKGGDERDSATFSLQRGREQAEIQIATTTMKVVEGLYQCSRCKSKKTYSRQVQTRSADEGMTSIIQCMECGKVWREYA
jgi:DNA-directed RNA polymerase subunit M/transcription elongation factor TFIIS